MNSFFVTGTDTGVGKTITSRAIIQALQQTQVQVVGYKPIAYSENESVYTEIQPQESDYGTEDNHDVLVLLNTSKEDLHYQQINSYTFNQNFTPILASEESSRIDINKIDQDLERLASKYEAVLVEGTFGWMTPLNKEIMFADWVRKHQMPVILVVGIKEGCINHTLLTTQSIIQMGVPLIGWVANRINPGLAYYSKIIDVLSQHINAPLLGEIPYIHHPEKQELGHFITNLDRLNYMKMLLKK